MTSRFVSLRHAGAIRLGVVCDDTIRLLPPRVDDLVALIAAGPPALQEARRQCASPAAESVPLSGAALLAPIRRFRRDVLCTGWNYWDHFEEGVGKRDGQEAARPVAPTFFTRGPDSVIGPYDSIACDPRISARWDYEAELIAELSFGTTLMPGDMLLTGTPGGVGHARTPPLFLEAGDEVVTVGAGIGEMRNRLEETDLFGDSSAGLPMAPPASLP
ncbi:MAG TPA: fumarylacetoacetate hydrolase family protein [Casimicrobiaceae bacterium]|nr:fumarylacetoacetate hydrolase family protein [Casimicrobiaceae bacterium]